MNIEQPEKKHKNKIIYIVSVLLAISVISNIYLAIKVSGFSTQYERLLEIKEKNEEQAESRANKLNERIDQLRKENTNLKNELSDTECDLYFYKANAVFVTSTGYKYHEFDCYHIAGRPYWIYNVEAAESMGYEPCLDCYYDDFIE